MLMIMASEVGRWSCLRVIALREFENKLVNVKAHISLWLSCKRSGVEELRMYTTVDSSTHNGLRKLQVITLCSTASTLDMHRIFVSLGLVTELQSVF